jgi:5'-nucleotidase/5'-nucleotidase/UDP-sugar diphosphatase
MPYADTLRFYHLMGHQLQALLADNALRLDYPDEPDVERGFLQFSRELKYTLNPGSSRTAAQVSAVFIHGTPLGNLLNETFTVVTTCFIRRLAEPWEAKWQPDHGVDLLKISQFPYVDTDIFLRSEMVAFIQEQGGVTRQTGARCDGRLKIEGR